MWIQRAIFENFGPHEYLELEFSQGLVGIFGPNGSGKSTITNGIYAALTNDFSRFFGVKTDQINKDASEGAKSRIVLDITHNGVDFRLTRGLQAPVANILEVGDRKPITNANHIQEELDGILGLSRQVLDNYVFINQGKMASMFAQTPTERSKVFMHLCRTAAAESLWALLGKKISALAEAYPVVEDNSDVLNEQIAANRRLLKAEMATKQTLVEAKLDKVIRKRLQEMLATKARHKVLTKAHEDAQPTLESLRKKRDRMKELADRGTRLVDEGAALVTELQDAATQAQAVVAAWERYDVLLAAYETYGREKKTLEDAVTSWTKTAPKPPEGYVTGMPFDALVDELSTLTAEIQRAKTIIENFEDTSLLECPTCGTPTKTLAGELTKHKATVKQGKPRQKELTSLIADCRAFETANQKWEKERNKRIAARDALKPVEEPTAPTGDRDAAQDVLDTFAKLQRDHKDLTEQAAEATNNANNAQAAFETAEAADKARVAELKKIKPATAAAIADAELKLAAHTQAVADLKAGRRVRDNLRSQIKQAQADIERIKTNRRKGAKARKLVEYLEGLRQVVQRDQLPQTVAQAALDDLEDDINNVLEEFGGPFRVTTTEGLAFEVHYPGRQVQRAEMLSGGQQSVLALGYYRAINTVFAAELGLLVLDEPTAWMAEDNVDYLHNSLQHFAREAKNRDVQILMVTHSHRLKPAFHQVIDLGNERKERKN